MSMTMTSMLFAGVAFLAGVASACQSHMNGALGRSISDPVGAALWSCASGTVLVLCLYLWRGGNLSFQNMGNTPGWAMFGGLMGLPMVLGVIMAVPKSAFSRPLRRWCWGRRSWRSFSTRSAAGAPPYGLPPAPRSGGHDHHRAYVVAGVREGVRISGLNGSNGSTRILAF
jgi:Putative inner membrane exporter, YdcZ